MAAVRICLTCIDNLELFKKGSGLILRDYYANRLVDPLIPEIFWVATWTLAKLEEYAIPYEVVRGDMPEMELSYHEVYHPKIVYFGAAIRGDRSQIVVVKALISFIRDLGIQVLSEHVGADDPNGFRAKKAGIRPEDVTDDYIERQDMEWIDASTHVIAEVSGASTGTGIEIGEARVKGQIGKNPVAILCLWDELVDISQSGMIKGMNPYRYPNVILRPYKHLDHAKAIIREFLEIQ